VIAAIPLRTRCADPETVYNVGSRVRPGDLGTDRTVRKLSRFRENQRKTRNQTPLLFHVQCFVSCGNVTTITILIIYRESSRVIKRVIINVIRVSIKWLVIIF